MGSVIGIILLCIALPIVAIAAYFLGENQHQHAPSCEVDFAAFVQIVAIIIAVIGATLSGPFSW